MKQLFFVLIPLVLIFSTVTNALFAQSTPSELEGSFSRDDHAIELRWHAPDMTPLSYKVYRRGPMDSTLVFLASAADRAYNDHAINAGAFYHYAVSAIFSSGGMMTVESGRSNMVAVQVPGDSAGGGDDSSHAGIQIVSHPLTHTRINQPYQYDLDVVTNPPGRPVCFQLHEAPDGLTIDSTNGVIQWTPHRTGLFEVEVRARICPGSEGEDAEQRYLLSVFSGTPGSVRGTVQNDSSRGLSGIRVRMFDVSGADFVFATMTDDSGKYSFPMVDPAKYFVRANDESGRYAPQWYNGVRHLENATPVVVAESGAVIIDFALHHEGQSGSQPFTLSGGVRTESDTALAGARVTAFAVREDNRSGDDAEFDDHGGHDGSGEGGDNQTHHGDDHLHRTETVADSTGHYALHLEEGSYILSASSKGFMTQFWNRKVSALEADHLLLKHDTAGIDFSLGVRPTGPGSISGTIRSANDSLPLESHVAGYLQDSLGHMTGFTATAESDSLGAYSLIQLPKGRYVLLAFDHGHDIVPTFYSASGGTPFLDSATAVVVETTAVAGIDIFARVDSVDGLNRVEGEIETESEGGSRTMIGVRPTSSVVPLAGALVVIKNTATGSVIGSSISNVDGSYQVPGIGAGSFVMTFQKPGKTTVAIPVSVAYVNNAPSAATVDAQLTASAPFGLATVTMNISPHWNLVSVPVAISNASVSGLFPSAASPAFSFSDQAGYQIAQTLTNGAGYWMQFRSTQAITVQGPARTAQSNQLHAGWNLIGALSVPVNAGAVEQSPPGLLTTRFFGYKGGYGVAPTLDPGQGYWIKASGAGTLTLNGNIAAPKSATADGTLKQLNSITIKSGDASQTLYFGGEQAGLRASEFELPPAGPGAGSFDARFASGRIVEVHPAQLKHSISYPMLISSQSPVTVSWSVVSAGVTYRVGAGDGSTGTVLLTAGQGTAALAAAGPQIKVMLTASASSLPKEFALEQNYPNPFNPSTTIAYALPQEARVVLKLFNLLGQEIKTLVDEVQPAGSRQLRVDASTLPSGIYLYRIEARSLSNSASGLTQVRKMVLLK